MMKSPKLLADTASKLKEVEDLIPKVRVIPDKLKKKLLKNVAEARENLARLSKEVTVDNVELARFLLRISSKLKEATVNLKSEGVKEYVKEVDKVLRYSRAARYDFTNLALKVKSAYRAYIIGLIPYFILSGFFGLAFAITALILMFPVIISVRGMKRRSSMGLFLASVSIPIPLVLGALAINYGVHALQDPSEISSVAAQLNIPYAAAEGLVALTLVLGVIELISLSYAAVMFYLHRHAFL